jgi:hypothetical protein
MRLLVLSSIPPDFGHFRAGHTVLAHLLENFVDSGIDIGVAIASSKLVSAATKDRLALRGIEILEGDEFALVELDQRARWFRRFHYLASKLKHPDQSYQHRFVQPGMAISRIKAFGADRVLLFWDTCFELLLNRMAAAEIHPFGYLARPPQAASLSTLSRVENPIERVLKRLFITREQLRHLRRLNHLRTAANICAVDAAWYTENGVRSKYISNTWPDSYGKEWKSIRIRAQNRRTGLHILANIGGLNATGNLFGMEYLGERILPVLKKELIVDWQVNICGRFELPSYLRQLLTDERVHLKGFVEDIDEEVAGNELFLLLNNAGPYTGGYTRVIYAFSSGACLIAHRRLAASMPELIHNENCLLGETPEEIIGHLVRLATDHNMRIRIGENARKTYEMHCAPHHVAQKLIAMMSGAGVTK